MLALAGFAQSLSMVTLAVVLLGIAGGKFRGRIMGVRMLAIYSLPLGTLAGGALIDWIGFPPPARSMRWPASPSRSPSPGAGAPTCGTPICRRMAGWVSAKRATQHARARAQLVSVYALRGSVESRSCYARVGVEPCRKTPRIIADPRIMMGKPVIEGTRITVELILTRLAEGRSVDDILIEYPHLTRVQVTAAIEHARIPSPRLRGEG